MNTIKINITKDPNYGFSNLEFSEKPTTEMLQELKNNGWRYSSHFKRWYPATEEAKKNAESFAQDYYRHYTSEEQTKTIKTAESLVDLNSIENSVDAYISEYENEMKKGNYNAFVEVQEFIKKNSFITPKAKSYINRFIHSIEDIKGVTAFVAYGSGFYSYDTGVSLISELNKKIENYESIKNNPGQNDYSDLLKMIKDELKMLDNSRNKGTFYSVLQKEGDSYEQKIRRSNERNNGDGRTDYSGESGNSLGNKVEEQRSVHNSDKISDPAGHSDSKMHDGLDSGRSTELEANGTSADIQRQRLQSNALEQEKLSETDKVNDSTRDAGNGTQNLSEGRVEVYSAERKGSIGAVGNGLNKYGEIQRKIYSYESFGYEGALVTVETDLRRGIPAIDIVGLADSAVKESRERVRAAFKNSGLEFPAERVLMSLSPADLKKDSAAHDLAIALSVLNEKYGYKGEPVLALGELELSGKLRPVRSVYAAVENAIKEGIRNIIVPKQNVEEVLAIPDVNVLGVSSLEEAHEKLINNEPFVTKESFVEPAKDTGIKFNEELLTSKKDLKAIREQCREILKKPDNEITNEDKLLLAQYEGAGGLNEENRTISGILNEFYTPNNLVEKVWQVVDTYAPEAKTVLEPSAGVGKFANNRPNNTFTMHELDETSARINKILHPEANVIQGAYQKQFFDAGERIHIPQQKAKYDVVIGNPPYGAYNDKYKGLGEGKEFDRYEEYFISKGLDALKDENSVMAYVVPSGFLNTASDKQKEILASKGKLIDAYRLPVGVFPTTEVGTDIIIMQSWEKERKDLQKHWDSQGRFLTIDEAIKAEQKGHVDLLSNGEWFRQHPEKILGEIKKRTNRFGKEEEYVAVHEGLTIQDELNKIEDLLPDTNKTQITQQAETVSNEKEQKPVTLSIEELSLAKSVIPEQQFITTLSLSKGEEGDFFKQKIKDIANAVSKAPKLYETDGAEQHALLFRYFHPAGTESLVCEIGEDGEAFGFQCINGDYIDAEWGYIDLNELKKIPEMQLDYHVPKGMSIERWLYKEQPDMYPDYAKFAEQSEKTPFDIAKETGNDVEAVANAMNEQTPSEKVYSETVGESVDDKSLREYDDPDGLFKTPKILSMQEFSKFYTGNNFDEKDYNIWANTDYRGIVNTASLSAEEKEYLKTSGKYVEPEPGIYTNAMLYATGKIYEKLDELEKQKENLSSESYEKCKSILEKAVPELYPMSKIQMDVLSPLAEEFTVTRTVTRKQWDYGAIKNVTSDENLNLKEDFLSWCTGYLQPDSENTRTYIQDFSVANVSREEIPENISFNDIAAYVDRIPVNTGISEDDTKEERNSKLTVAGAKKDARKETAYKLFNRYLQTGLSAEEKEQFCLFWNKIYNGTVQADYKKLPLFIDGMSTYKGREPFKLYKQQIEGINRLVSKGNGLLGYDVGVGKTAAGICASIAQMQSKRAKRPLIICPDQVYEKWVRDLRELFPNVTINELGNLSDPFLEANHYDEATHSLIIPENSVSVMIDSALQKITFTDEACNEYLAKDFGCVLGLSAELESGDDRDRANAQQKIQNLVGKASRIKTVKVPGDNIARETEIQQSYVFFDRCNWDNICVDEAHKYKNLFVIPRAKKGDKKQANEFEGIGSAAQSRRALKMFGMTTIIQQQNENRNVFLLTATPFNSNPLEVYSMLSFMARKELLDRHIYDVRDFCTEFALTKNEYAVTPDGDIKPKNVMKAFKGQKKLHSLITEFIDSRSAEDAGIPKPEGERHAVFLELTDLQQAIINYNEAAIKNASGKDGVVLRAMTHMRTATLSPALLDSDDYPGLDIPPLEKIVECSPKLKYVCDTVADVYKHKPECGQFIYMPQGVESFQYVKEYLIKQSVPEEAIEYVSGKHNNTNKKKQKVADRFNDKEDKLKILIGSSNVAEGIDLNGNSICCYNTMLGWNPTESVQVEGRIWRQGNEQGKVHIYYPLMEDSIDALIYQKHDEKASRINSIFKENENDQDTIDVSEIDPETVKFELIKDPVKKVDMLIEQDSAEFKKELKILENRTETINDLVKAYGIIKNMIAEQKSEHEKYSELVKQYRENLKNIPENDSTRWQHEGKLEAAVHTRDVAYKELQKGNARMNSIMTNFMRMDIKVPETEAAIKLEEIARKKQAVLEKIESIEKSKDKRIEEEQIKLLQKKLVAKPLEQQRKETVEYILKNTWYKTTEEKVEPEKPVVKDASITTEPITSILIELEERFNEALEKKDFKVLSQFCCWGDRNSIKEYSENNAAIKIFCDQFEKKYNIGLPSDIGDRFITLVNFCDPETLPEEYKFKDLEEAISYELKDLNSGTENSSKRIKEFYEKKPNVNEFANFLKEEYGTGGHSFIGYDHWHDAKGIKLTALINGKKESKLYSWNEIASRMSKIIEKSRPRVDFEIMSEEKRKSFDSFQQQDLFGFEELNPSKVLEYGEYDEIGFTSKFINANKGLLPVIKEKEDVYKVYCKGKDIHNYESSKDIYIHDADDVEISVSKNQLQNVARQYIQNKVIENIKSEYEDCNFKKKKIAVPKLSEITVAQKDVFIKNGIKDENEMLKMYRETYKDVLLSGEKPIFVAKKQDSSVSVTDSRAVTEEATYIINDDNIGY